MNTNTTTNTGREPEGDATMTTAGKIAARLDDDGGRFFDDHDTHIETICVSEGGRPLLGGGMDATRWDFPDGSAIVVVGGAWDLAVSGSGADCFCWDGNGCDCVATK